MNDDTTFADYFETWINTYKVGAIREVTLKKYRQTLKSLRSINNEIKLKELDRMQYQQVINKYAETHERQTVFDFHTQLKASVKDAVYEEYLCKDVTYGVVIKGLKKRTTKKKYLNETEYKKLLNSLDPSQSEDVLIYLLATTGLRFSEAIALTIDDVDFDNQIISVNKTWNYKDNKNIGFDDTKNQSSIRTIIVDRETLEIIKVFHNNNQDNQTIFVKNDSRIYNSSFNKHLKERCKELEINEISLHSLRHTHASLLIRWGVSINSIAKRLGHADTTTTQKVYSHLIQELEERDNRLILEKINNEI